MISIRAIHRFAGLKRSISRLKLCATGPIMSITPRAIFRIVNRMLEEYTINQTFDLFSDAQFSGAAWLKAKIPEPKLRTPEAGSSRPLKILETERSEVKIFSPQKR